MSTNLIYNGDFMLPTITLNGPSLVYTSFTTTQASQFYWTCANNYIYLIAGVPNSFYIDPSTIGYVQFILILQYSSISQSFTVANQGSYILSFYYAPRLTSTFNNIQIYINGVLFDTLTTTPSGWVNYSKTVYNLIIGTNSISFVVPHYKDIAA